MNRLFVRLLLFLACAVFGASALTIALLDHRFAPAENAQLEAFLQSGLPRLAERIGAGEPEQEVIADGRLGVGNMLAVLDARLLEFDAEETRRLAAGQVVIRGTGFDRAAFAAVPDQERVVELLLASFTSTRVQWANLPGLDLRTVPWTEPLSTLAEARAQWRPVPVPGGVVIGGAEGPRFVETPRLTNPRGLTAGLTFLGMGLAILASLVPVRRQLIALAQQAGRLREGDLSARVPLEAVGGGAVGEVAQQFNAMADRVEALVRSQEELLLSASHELQTPLARLMFSIDALGEEAGDKAVVLSGMRQTVDQMRVLAEELLAFNRLARGQEHLLERVVLDVAELVSDLAESTEACAETAGPAWAEADARLLYRALRNLVENAFVYATPPTLRVTQTAEEVVVHVDDSGPGIPIAARSRIFEPFQRLEGSRARSTGGTGLGLAIVERVCARLGGSVQVGESPEGGARFTVTLPAAARPPTN